MLQKCCTVVNILLFVKVKHQEVPEASDKVSTNDGNNNQSKYLVAIHQNVLCDDPILPLGGLKQLLEKPVDPGKIKDGPYPGQPCESQELGHYDVGTIFVISRENLIKRESGHKIDD